MAGNTSEQAILAEKVVRTFGHVHALDGLDLAVHSGEILGLVGPNGAGKTTFIRIVAGLLRPTRGTVLVLGDRPARPRVNERIGYMTQSAALYEDLTLRDNLIFFGRLYGMRARDARRRATELAELTTLGAKLSTQVRDLSGGQRQLANLSCAMVHQPKLLLLDEPTVGVDPVLRRSLWRHFGELNAEGTTMLVTTHVMEEAEHCHRVAMISAGRAIALGTPEELRRTAGAATLEEAYLAFSDGSGRPEEEAT